MRIPLTILFMIVGVSTGHAGCSVEVFKENGLYYSETGDPKDAYRNNRLNLTKIDPKTYPKFTALEGVLDRDYSPDGKFFVRSGANEQDFILVLPADDKKQEAVLVRRVSRTRSGKTPEYVSISRSDVPYASCNTNVEGGQNGLSGSRHFIKTSTYLLAHSDPAELARKPLLNKKFHFFFQGNSGCKKTSSVVDESGRDRSQEAYTGVKQGTTFRSRGSELIEQTTYEVAQVFLPRPAYASYPSIRGDKTRVEETPKRVPTGVEASLFDMSDRKGVCIEIPAPVPTGKLSKGFFGIFADPQVVARKTAKRGDWKPEVTEFHFQQVDNHKQSALIRLIWK